MNILIITTYFPPDSTIAAVRPYMFAKYLIRSGHQVTVLRSGEFYRNPDHSFLPLEKLRIISYMGEDSPAEAFGRGEEIPPIPSMHTKGRLSFLPPKIRKPISWAYHTCTDPGGLRTLKNIIKSADGKLARQKQALEALRDEGERFDVIFATYGALENIYAGKYAAALFECPWILDLRDPIAQPLVFRGPALHYLKRIQDRAISQADACTVVSDGMRTSSPGLRECPKAVTLYNGYEPLADDTAENTDPGIFSICYTGTLYNGKSDATALLKALKQLGKEGKINLNRVRIHYAGPDFHYMRENVEAQGIESCLVDHGYTSRTEASCLQNNSDIFLVLAWNTKTMQGAISGKFYEGIRCRHPILALVSGDLPDSELYLLNQRYRYGFCYEESRRKELFPKLCDFLAQAYTQKMENGSVDYAPTKELAAAFQYEALTKQLEGLCEKLILEKKMRPQT